LVPHASVRTAVKPDISRLIKSFAPCWMAPSNQKMLCPITDSVLSVRLRSDHDTLSSIDKWLHSNLFLPSSHPPHQYNSLLATQHKLNDGRGRLEWMGWILNDVCLPCTTIDWGFAACYGWRICGMENSIAGGDGRRNMGNGKNTLGCQVIYRRVLNAFMRQRTKHETLRH